MINTYQEKKAKKLGLRRDVKAVSALVVILLILISLIIGGLLSYVWVMSNYYLESSKTSLSITEALFPIDHGDYFNLTVLNPSHSATDTNITAIYLTVEGNLTLLNVTSTEPVLPLPIARASYQTIKCNFFWSLFAGKTITAHVLGENSSGDAFSVQTAFVGLTASAGFNATQSSKYFNLTVSNDKDSAINLTLSKVYYNYLLDIPDTEMPDVTLNSTLIANGTSIAFTVFHDWTNFVNPVIRVRTLEGYIADAPANASASFSFFVANVTFNNRNPNQLNLTMTNTEESSTLVDLSEIVLTYDNGTTLNLTTTNPSLFPTRINVNSTVTLTFDWSWINYREQNLTTTAYTQQGFATSPLTVKTPAPVIYEITSTTFNLNDTSYFLANITNSPSSNQSITISEITLNTNSTSFTSTQPLLPGEEREFNCTGINWTDLRGTVATLTTNTTIGILLSQNVTVPDVDLTMQEPMFGTTADNFKYVSLTLLNSAFSVRNVTITQVVFTTPNKTDTIDGTISLPQFAPDGYLLTIGSVVTFRCLWNWDLYSSQNLTITVQTSDGLTVSQTFTTPA